MPDPTITIALAPLAEAVNPIVNALVSVALPRYLHAHNAYHPGAQIIPWLACAAMLLALIGNLYPVPEGPYGKLPYIYLAYLVGGLTWFFWRARHQEPAAAERQA